ncbi:MAG: lipocalin family protein [Planctomycetes bacterium]|nr:lipocalin family protein [Planctomycetota bacterium]
MKHFLFALPLLLIACGAKGADLTLTVSGVAMADLEKIRGDLSGLKGVSDVRAGVFKVGQAVFTVKFEGKGSDLAARLATLGSGLKNVKGFDDASVQISYGGVEEKPAAVAPAAAPLPAPEKPAAKPEAKGEAKEVKVEMKKDPLAYKVHQLAGGTIATFEGWKVNALPGDSNWTRMETHPDGKENEFQLIVSAGTPGTQVMANLFEEAAAYLQQGIPGLRPAGEAQKCVIGGDDARLQDYTLEAQGRTLKVQSIIIRKKDVAVSVLAFGTEESFKEYGRSAGITAQSITIKEEPPDRAVVGTWLLEKYTSTGAGTSNQFSYSSSRSMTIYPNGTFSEMSSSSAGLNNSTGRSDAYLTGGDRGKVIKRGNTLSFTYDNGKVWNAEYKLDGGALVLNGNYWLRQQ